MTHTSQPAFTNDLVTLYAADCFDMFAELDDDSIDAIVTDPPYALDFLGHRWDRFTPGQFQNWCEKWAVECLRVLKPGGHMLVFGGTRTWHRLAAGIEDAGFEIRDSMAWLYGSGFPKSMDVSKAIDKAARGVPQGGSDPTSPNHGKYRTTTTEGKRWEGDSGRGYGAGGSRFLADGAGSASDTVRAESGDVESVSDDAKQWGGWGTALKPAFEPIVCARKPLGEKTVAANVLTHGTGALNIDACRVEAKCAGTTDQGRWPANALLDGEMADQLDMQSGALKPGGAIAEGSKGAGRRNNAIYGVDTNDRGEWQPYGDSGGASRFFPVFRYQAKAPTKERPKVDGVAHPTVKPLALIEWLVKLVAPQNSDAVVLDPFAGSGTTVEACLNLGVRCIAGEREETYIPLIMERVGRSKQSSR